MGSEKSIMRGPLVSEEEGIELLIPPRLLTGWLKIAAFY
jgi:hypothetical protein